MSDIQDLLGGTKSDATGIGPSAADQKVPAKKRRPTPKPAWVTQREKATGIDAQWSDEANAGRGGYIFPGLSPKMGGPSKGSTADQNQGTPEQQGSILGSSMGPAFDDFLMGKYQDSYDKLLQLEKTDPNLKNDPRYKRFRKRLEVELNIS